ncbi:spore gernimation protein [Oceanobacillus sp. 143]|uniref:Spore gernimation protein n=1 Tax=Oceanobacillus zhaokaii TaxID=2052660 RepID=A0A345PHY5_9BACI|nr:GerMN domain-containing protein [Oceanobacillus zhaokaii]AXI09615.1 spore gernimation protein [Oceanobacillus zhaokaii]QGS68973.1 spore gernimation protein [Oceanobacillus sp. 143]
MQKKGLLMTGAITLSVLLTGCFQGEQSLEDLDPPQNAEEVNNLEKPTTDEDSKASSEESEQTEGEETSEVAEETVPRQLFLLDANGMVASQTLELPKLESKEVATQVIEYLVKGGPVTEMLPNGFQAVLPEGTEVIGVNLKEDGTMIVDLSEEFKDYQASEELQILESVTHTLTQFENVNKVQLWINGHPQTEMPVNGTPIGEGYSRANGINITDTDTLDLVNSQAVTMYYPAEHGENRYYVPVTQYVEKGEEEFFHSIVQSLLEGPGYQADVVNVFNSQTDLASEPVLSDGVLELVFNEEILKDSEQGIIADEVMETLVRTLTEQEAIDAVDIKVENKEKLVNENGESYDEPVTKQTFTPTEKL